MMNFLRRPWTLQYASSLYANRCWRTAWSNLLPGQGNALALLGNCISVATPAERDQSAEFLLKCSTWWNRIFVVPGPGEYAGGPAKKQFWELMDETRQLATDVQQLSGGGTIEVLDQAEATIPYRNIVVLGAGGWGPGEEGKSPKGAAASIRFAQGISAGKELATWSEEDMAFLSARVKWHWREDPETQIVILTHSLSKGRLLESGLPASVYERMTQEIVSPESSAAVLKRPNVYAWLSGALGSCVSGMHGGTFLSSNAFYVTENRSATNPNYLADRHITVGPSGGGLGSLLPSLPTVPAAPAPQPLLA